MNTQEKLTLTEQTPAVCFIKDSGLFCGLYNQSAYIVTQLLKRPLKLHIKSIKKLNNQKIISCGIPIKSVLNYFPTAIATDWGFALSGEFDLTGYDEWREQEVMRPENVIEQQIEQYIVKRAKQSFPKHPNDINCMIDELDIANKFTLTPQQIAFLLTWEKAKYPTNVDSGFLEDLTLNLKEFIDSITQ